MLVFRWMIFRTWFRIFNRQAPRNKHSLETNSKKHLSRLSFWITEPKKNHCSGFFFGRYTPNGHMPPPLTRPPAGWSNMILRLWGCYLERHSFLEFFLNSILINEMSNIYIWAGSKTPVILLCRSLVIRTSGVRKTQVGVSRRKLFIG